MVDVNKIQKLLTKYFVVTGDVMINPVTGRVDVKGSVTLKEKFKVDQLPVQFGEVSGDFVCWKNTLTTLLGSPRIAHSFICEHNLLKSLEHGPRKVRSFRCGYNQITTLAHAPQVGGSFECQRNQLTSLQGAPDKLEGSFNCGYNKLTSLEGCPTHVGYEFDCSMNELTSLAHGPQDVGSSGGPFGGHYLCANNLLTNLVGAPKVVPGMFTCHENPLKSLKGIPDTIGKVLTVSYEPNLPLLRVLTYPKLRIQLVDAPVDVYNILMKYEGQGKQGALACAAELIKLGYKGNARW